MDNSSNQPIGFFDSGIGGLTVANAVSKLLPNEQIIYFGDTAHLPYGDKSRHAIQHYSEEITRFLLEKNCKAVIIACNTASSYAYQHIADQFSDKAPIINVIDPIVHFIKERKDIKTIGVIGTKGTIQSGVYEKKINSSRPDILVKSLATPLFVPMIEEGFVNSPISRTVIAEYLTRTDLKDIEGLILACTHYPVIRQELEDFLDGKVIVFDTASIVAEFVKSELKRMSLINEESRDMHHFYVSDFTPFFEKITKVFFGEKLHLEYSPIWE